MLICFVRIKTAIANIYANAEYIVVLFTELILPSMPKREILTYLPAHLLLEGIGIN